MSASTTLELLGGQSWTTRPRVLGIHPAIGDTSALVDDLMASVRYGQVSPLLDAMEFGLVRLFVAHHVWAEVPRKLEEIGASGRLDRHAAEHFWWTRYARLIRAVDTSVLPSHGEVEELLARDPSDAPTGELAGLLAPVVVLALDPDLVDLGFAHPDWRPAARAGRNLAATGGTAYGGLVAMSLAGKATLATFTGIGRLLRHPYGRFAVVAGGAALLVASKPWSEEARGRASAARAELKELIEPLTSIAQGIRERTLSAFQAWDASKRGVYGGTLTHAAARLLAATPNPLTRSEIAPLLQGEFGGSRRELVHRLGVVLPQCSAFVEVSRGRWQLGRAEADFGVSDEWRVQPGAASMISRYERPPSLVLRLALNTIPSSSRDPSATAIVPSPTTHRLQAGR